MRRRAVAVGVCSAVAALGLSACGLVHGGSGQGSASPTSWGGRTLVVWLMKGDDQQAWMTAVRSEFGRAYPGAKVDFEVQDWNGIEQKVTDALAQLNPPDVIDIGNTQTPFYAANGGLLQLTPYLAELGASGWTKSMNASAVFQGKQYAAPWYAGNRVVMYNKLLWKKAGLGAAPQTLQEWEDDLARLQNTAGVSSALWLPGQNWYAFDGFLQDQGAPIVQRVDGAWAGDLESPAGLRAAAVFKKLQAYGHAPTDGTEAGQATVFAKGDVGCMIAMGYEGAQVTAANPGLNNQIGWFPIPGAKAGQPAKTFLGGSDLTISQNTANKELAVGFLKVALDDANEALMARSSGFLPNRASLYPALAGNAYAQAAAKSVPYAGYTPLLPGWGNVETTPNPVITLFLTPYLKGKDPVVAAQAADAELTRRLGWN
ncbi:sugar transporter [Streptacidiphilus pinicola]|uniref:Sugar transporter n=1 Tax=Streptacidiphilus pinicola TaxID=2219663 RepID=A0A2X0IMC3_9ACTN|nr:extracellular solute-binding protein [Streptacidiphilus pinicola]RAG86274.1 sugar transporter [Streptacidiphilus pinicola]